MVKCEMFFMYISLVPCGRSHLKDGRNLRDSPYINFQLLLFTFIYSYICCFPVAQTHTHARTYARTHIHICGVHRPSTQLQFPATVTKPSAVLFCVSAVLHFDISFWIFTRQQDCRRDDSNIFVGAQVLQMTFAVCVCTPLWIRGSVFRILIGRWLLALCR